jgi:hypothetical protein
MPCENCHTNCEVDKPSEPQDNDFAEKKKELNRFAKARSRAKKNAQDSDADTDVPVPKKMRPSKICAKCKARSSQTVVMARYRVLDISTWELETIALDIGHKFKSLPPASGLTVSVMDHVHVTSAL